MLPNPIIVVINPWATRTIPTTTCGTSDLLDAPAMERRQSDLGQPAEGDDGDGDPHDEVDRLERRLVAIADDRDFDRDPDQQSDADDERGTWRKRMAKPGQPSGHNGPIPRTVKRISPGPR